MPIRVGWKDEHDIDRRTADRNPFERDFVCERLTALLIIDEPPGLAMDDKSASGCGMGVDEVARARS